MQALVASQAQQAILIAQIQAGATVNRAPMAVPAPPAPVPLLADAGPTLAHWIGTFEQVLAQREYDEQTRKNRRSSVAHVKRLWGDKPLRGLKPFEIAAGLKTLTSHTAGRVLAELRDCYTEAIANGQAETNPASHIKPPKHSTLRERLTLDTWQRMLTLSEDGPQKWVTSMLLLLLALATGQRRADLGKMRFDDVVDGCLRIEQQKRAGKPIGARVEIPLTLYSEATGMTLAEVIEHCRGSAKEGPTLLRKAGGGAIELSSLTARFHELIVAALGADAFEQWQWPSLHEARSLSARCYLDQGLTMQQVQTLLGHKHAEMTALYLNDRGLSAAQWKRVELAEAAID